jgi:hypothetical protein
VGKIQTARRRHVLIHFDLNTTRGARDKDYNLIDTITSPAVPRKLTGSVYIVLVPSGQELFDFAVKTWESMAQVMRGHLRAGDKFFLHICGEQDGANIFHQTVEDDLSLDATPEVTMLERLFK